MDGRSQKPQNREIGGKGSQDRGSANEPEKGPHTFYFTNHHKDMNKHFDYQAALSAVAKRPQDLKPADAERAVEAGRQRFDAILFQNYVHWMLHYTSRETREAILTAYLTIEARSEA